MINYSDFKWKKVKDKQIYKLYLRNRYMGKVFPGEESLFWIEFADGIKSADYYNLTRAKDNLIKYLLDTENNGSSITSTIAESDLEKPAGAFK